MFCYVSLELVICYYDSLQLVHYGGYSSLDVHCATLGVPQGFDFGPSLYLIFISDLSCVQQIEYHIIIRNPSNITIT